MSDRVVAYVRVSTKEQAESNTSLEQQELAIREYSKQHALKLLQVFVEPGVSARTLDRPALWALRHFCAEPTNQVSRVLIWKFDRLCRDVSSHAALRTELTTLDISVTSVTEPTTADPVGKLLENLLVSFAQFENDNRSERTRIGMRATAALGRWQSRPQVGSKFHPARLALAQARGSASSQDQRPAWRSVAV